jgi:hypothetical protein
MGRVNALNEDEKEVFPDRPGKLSNGGADNG